MIILFLLCNHFLHGDVLAVPLQPTFEIPFYPREIDPSKFTQRFISDIVWTCFTTIFACSWVAVHPNIPAQSDSFMRIFFTRLKIMGCMLIAPEFVVVWAGRQWYAAHYIAERHKEQKWTTTHGFFASMGGFMLYDNGVPIETLGIERLEQLSFEEKIDWPSISQEDIQDKSKGDFFSKGLAVVQTTWFIVQCIARSVVELNVTELELATLAFAVLNIVVYILWWHKPLAVHRPVAVHLRHSTFKPRSSLPIPPSSVFARFRAYVRQKFKDKGLFAPIYILIIKPFKVIWVSLNNMRSCDAIVSCKQTEGPSSVPTFYAPFTPKRNHAIFFGLGVGILFGGFHCIAWSFHFPSIEEKYLWRTSAIVITVIPLSFVCISSLYTVNRVDRILSHLVSTRTLLESAGLFLVIYCVSRVALLILPLLALRSLPPESLLDFRWPTFIPHI